MSGPQPTQASFCTGVGGLDLGVAEVFGARHVWHAEMDKGASAVLAERFPGVANYGDLTVMDWSAAESVDVLTMGFPCQPFSAAGLRRGTDDHRHLFPMLVTAIEKLPARPQWLVVENVPNLVTIQDGAVWRHVQDELMRLGYGGVWRIAPAAAVEAAHLRKRVFLVAQLGRYGFRRSLVRYSRSGVPLLKTPTAQLAINGGSQHPDKRKAGGHGPTLADEVEWLLPTPRTTEARGVGKRGLAEGYGKGLDLRTAVALLPTPTTANSHGNGVNNRGESLLPGLAIALAQDWGKYAPAIERWERVFGQPAPLPTESGARSPRVLSVRFVEWLMGLPEGWVTGVPELKRNAQLKALGNGVVPLHAATIVRELLEEMG